MDAPRIIVGYDGSPAGRAAVIWAAAEANRTSTALHLVYVYEFAWPGAMYEGMSPPLADEAEQHADQLVADMVRELRATTPGLDATGTAIRGAPAQTLLYLGDQATLLVVGQRGSGGFTDLLLGSVSQQVSTHAHGPVAVVRGRTDATGGPVVVGVDGSDSTDQALGLAFEAAVARGTEVVAIRTYAPPTPPGRSGHSPVVTPLDVIEAEERAALHATLAGWSGKYPAVKVEALLVRGRAAEVLIGVSKTAQLMVVGSRGHGGFVGLLLGSVGQQLMHHAECPVLIAHR